MNKATTILSAVLLATIVAGCDGMKSNEFNTSMPKYEWKTLPGESLPRLVRVDQTPKPAPAPLPTTAKPTSSSNDAFDGRNLRVTINNIPAKVVRVDSGEPIFSAPPVENGKVNFRFEYQKSVLGSLQSTRITIYPIVDGKAASHFYKPEGTFSSKTVYPLAPLKHVVPGKGIEPVKALPPGKYLLRLRAMGSKAMEQQTIEFHMR